MQILLHSDLLSQKALCLLQNVTSESRWMIRREEKHLRFIFVTSSPISSVKKLWTIQRWYWRLLLTHPASSINIHSFATEGSRLWMRSIIRQCRQSIREARLHETWHWNARREQKKVFIRQSATRKSRSKAGRYYIGSTSSNSQHDGFESLANILSRRGVWKWKTEPGALKEENDIATTEIDLIEDDGLTYLERLDREFEDIVAHQSWVVQLLEAVESLPLCLSIATAQKGQRGFPLVYVNQFFETTTGYTREEILGQNCRFLQKGNRFVFTYTSSRYLFGLCQ